MASHWHNFLRVAVARNAAKAPDSVNEACVLQEPLCGVWKRAVSFFFKTTPTMNMWLKTAEMFLIIYIATQFATIIFAPLSLTGTARFNPYIYFSVFLLLLPFLSLVLFFALFWKGQTCEKSSLYARVCWDLVSFAIVAFMGLVAVSVPAVRYMIVYGNATSLASQESGLAYIGVHAASMVAALFSFYWGAFFVYAWTLNAYPLRTWVQPHTAFFP